ncbi:MAG: response regulator transcription factor [Chloroflexi bacterium]|nr:response regulator transcription factor [Chloroflexota bacterium]
MATSAPATERGRTAETSDQIKVVIVDDQEVIRDAFGILLSNEPTVDLMGALGDGESAIKMIPVLRPDVVVMDVKMPGINGIAAAQRIREGHPEVGIILLSAYDDSEYIREFLKDDPRGKAYLLKQTLGRMDELVRTIHDVASGRTVLDPIMVEKLTSEKGIAENSPLKSLTRRELEVMSLMAKACTNSTIASILYIQPRTVEHHINSIFSKLNIAPEDGQHARVQAVLAYLKATGQTRLEAFA